MAELEELKADVSALMDKPMDSPEVKAWTRKILAIKIELRRRAH